MLFPFTRSWTRQQKWLIVLVVLSGIGASGGLVYSYEHHFRGLREADLVGTWARVDPGSGGGYYEFRADGTIVLLDDDGQQPTDMKGKWYAGGNNIYVRFPPDVLPDRRFVVWHIVDISRDQFRVRIWQDDEGLAVWRRMKPVARAPVDLSNMPTTEVDVKP